MEICKLLMRESMPKKDLFRASEIVILLGMSLDKIFEWESEFPPIWSIKSAENIRYYDLESFILFASIKHLLEEKNQSIPLALKVIAETDNWGDVRVQALRSNVLQLTAIPSVAPAKFEEELLLHSSSLLVEEEEGFDERVQEIYNQYAHSIDDISITVEPAYVGEMLKDALAEEQRRELQRYKQAEFERTRDMLLQKKQTLYELLGALDNFGTASFLVL